MIKTSIVAEVDKQFVAWIDKELPEDMYPKLYDRMAETIHQYRVAELRKEMRDILNEES